MKSYMIRSEKRTAQKSWSNPFSGKRVTPRFYLTAVIALSVLVILFALAIASAKPKTNPETSLALEAAPKMDIEVVATTPTPEPVEETASLPAPEDFIIWGAAEAEEMTPTATEKPAVTEEPTIAETEIPADDSFFELPDLTDDFVDPFTAELYGLNDTASSDFFAASEVVHGTQRITTPGLPTYFEWDTEEVKLIQEALNNWFSYNGYSYYVAVDGAFGPATSMAVKYFQYKSGLEMDGVLGPKGQKTLGLYGELSEKYYFYNVNLASLNLKNGRLIYGTLADRKVTVYDETFSGLEKVGSTSCTIGKNSTPTPSGVYKVEGRKMSLTKYPEARYCTNFTGGYYFHTTLSKHESTGKAKSHGCIRLPEKYAKWLYENAENGTTVVIDDRPSYAE